MPAATVAGPWVGASSTARLPQRVFHSASTTAHLPQCVFHGVSSTVIRVSTEDTHPAAVGHDSCEARAPSL